MTKTDIQKVLIGQTASGYVAASVESPFFCFEAETEEAVLVKASKALAFYGHQQAVPAPAPRSRTLNTLFPTRVIPGLM